MLIGEVLSFQVQGEHQMSPGNGLVSGFSLLHEMAAQILTFDPDGGLHLMLLYPIEIQEKIYHDGFEDFESDETAFKRDPTVLASGSVRMLVSSKHLMLASPVFKVMLGNQNLKSILMNIVHGHTRKVPRRVSLRALSRLSILVDKYQMLGVVELFSDTWIQFLKKDLPPSNEFIPLEIKPEDSPLFVVQAKTIVHLLSVPIIKQCKTLEISQNTQTSGACFLEQTQQFPPYRACLQEASEIIQIQQLPQTKIWQHGKKIRDLPTQGDLVLILTHLAKNLVKGEKQKADEKEDATPKQHDTTEGTAISQSEQAADQNFCEEDRTAMIIPTDNPQQASSGPIYMVVSYRHLMLASPVFNAMLQHQNFKEGKALSEGKAEVLLPDDGPDAFEILLNIIHGRSRAVPMFSDTRIGALNETLPKTSDNKEVMPWLGIAWVFKKPAEFKYLTKILEHEQDDKMEDIQEVIPIPDIIIGSRLKSAAMNKVSPPPTEPYEGYTFDAVASSIRNLEYMALCDNISQVTINGVNPRAGHGLRDSVEEEMKALEDRLCGLELEDFLGKAKIANT
ncbi:hypothetical protein G7Y89_g8873 [Cudoniella acicularis]|uniref:BTB domain-containing protein n=1 Tax=Cudoniella acicularis TaxID=354080 RepID=A0A8H4RIL4_9HELO|nr:hypothetical protein G7Y89_g8873 [Cudoniella acicularis]